MGLQLLQTIFMYFVCVYAFEDLLHVYGQANQEMIEHGRIQYQLLKERSDLPQYGPCWKAAVEHLNEGCKHLSEDTQSDIALHITNCFLETSGHETYNCELDKKPNLRAICINSMSDRAFNVYTEFYTHTQNICWFLRGQIWYETITENTLKVGKQLELSARNQEGLLRAQQESMELQDKMLQQGKYLEMVLEDLYTASNAHKDILMLLSQTITNLQTWIIGEVSWIDSIIFYIATTVILFFVTSSRRTATTRVPIYGLLLLNFFIERLICSTVIFSTQSHIQILYSDLYHFIWYTRYGFLFISFFILVYKAIVYKDLVVKNYEVLQDIKEQNNKILKLLNHSQSDLNKSNVKVINESSSKLDSRNSWKNELFNNCSKNSYENNLDCKYSSLNIYKENDSYQENILDVKSNRNRKLPLNCLQINKYNLRSSVSRQGTPEC